MAIHHNFQQFPISTAILKISMDTNWFIQLFASSTVFALTNRLQKFSVSPWNEVADNKFRTKIKSL